LQKQKVANFVRKNSKTNVGFLLSPATEQEFKRVLEQLTRRFTDDMVSLTPDELPVYESIYREIAGYLNEKDVSLQRWR
jgi:hypothetical protein